MDRGGDASLLRRLNTAAALRVVRAREEVTVPELAGLIGVSRPTAQDLTAQLLREGRLVELEASSGAVGRPARRFRFRAEAGHVVGVDIGAHKVLVHAVDLLGRTVAAQRVVVTPAMTARRRLKAVRGAIEACLAKPEAMRRAPTGHRDRHQWHGGSGGPGGAEHRAARLDRTRPGP